MVYGMKTYVVNVLSVCTVTLAILQNEFESDVKEHI